MITRRHGWSRFLKLDGNKPEIQKVIDAYRPGAAEGQQGHHFYKGKIGRFRESYSPEEQAILNEKLAPYLRAHGIRDLEALHSSVCKRITIL